MFRRGRGSGRGRGRGGSNVSAVRLKGLFEDGTWHCNCNPRLPAEHFKVRKEGKNQGRWFYTCQKPDSQRCDFFLWDDDAKPREEAAVLNNSRNEPRPSNPTTPSRSGARKSSPPPPYTPSAGPSHGERNQADVETEDEDEETFAWPLTGAEEEQVARQADAVSPPPVTPKRNIVSNAYATPTTNGKRKISNVEDVEYPVLPTPQTSKKVAFEDLPTRSDTSTSSRTIAGSSSLTTPHTTPTPSRFKDAISGQDGGFDITSDVLNILQQHKVRLDNDALSSLRELLNKSSLRAQGIIKGRDISRLQIKAKDAKIAEQQLRIATLEAELEAERAMVQHLRWEKQNGTDGD